jgi:predicted anti-sigma-YlaC factor YlaD
MRRKGRPDNRAASTGQSRLQRPRGYLPPAEAIATAHATRIERKTMLHKLRIALAVTLLALATVSVVDSASASYFGRSPSYSVGYILSGLP